MKLLALHLIRADESFLSSHLLKINTGLTYDS